MKKGLLFTALILLSITVSFSQRGNGGGKMDFSNMPSNGRIFGTVIDEATQEPVPYASVAMFNHRDSSLNGGLTDIKGRFDVTELSYGMYTVTISFMGYESKEISQLRVTPRSLENDLGTLSMSVSSQTLDEVEVVTEKRLVETTIDKKVFNMDKSLTSDGGSAEDAMRNVPGVDVDIDGNISVRGNQNVTILIDGKPSALTGTDRQAILDQIPASAIESIEIITNPSAKYDPDGMAGIINIVLKKNKLQGFNGTVGLDYGYDDQYNGTASLNFRDKKWNVFSNYSFRSSDRFSRGISDRTTFFNDTTQLLQNTDGNRLRNSHMIKLGSDYNISPKLTLSLSGSYNNSVRSSNETISYLNYSNEGVLFEDYNRFSTDENKSETFQVNFGFDKSFKKKKQKLTSYIDYSFREGDGLGLYNQVYSILEGAETMDPELNQKQIDDDFNTMLTYTLDYTHPVNENLFYETGFKMTGRFISQDFTFFNDSTGAENYVEDTNLSNHFNYDEKIFASYGIVNWKKEKLNVQVGLRAEQALTLSHLIDTDERFENNYFSLYPSAHIVYKKSLKTSYNLSYSRRVNRPSHRSLNPFVDYSDPLNTHQGNPFLRPEYINSIEAGISKYTKAGMFSGSVYYRDLNDMIQRVKLVDSTGVGSVTWDNYNGSQSYGLELMAMVNVKKKLKINASANLFQSITDGSNLEIDLSNNAFGMFSRLTSTYTILKGLDLQLSGFYRAPMRFAIGHISSMYSIDSAIKYTFLKDKASLNFRVSDVLNTREFNIYTADGFSYVQNSERKRESRFFYLGFSYRFGKMSVNDKKRRRGGGQGDYEDDGGLM